MSRIQLVAWHKCHIAILAYLLIEVIGQVEVRIEKRQGVR